MVRSFCLLIATPLVFAVVFLFPAAHPAIASPADHLIISEVVVKTRLPVTTFGSPFIEIVNPTGAAIPMDYVYLTDGTTAPAVFYYNITLLDPATANPGGGVGGDFHARFPAGYSLAAGDTCVIALNGSTQYETAYGRKPDFELYEEATTPDDVPELLEAYQGSIGAGLGGTGNIPVLSDVAESLVLYIWNGSYDLVLDLDYVFWGSNTAVRIDKSGVTVGAATYHPDTPIFSQEAAAISGPTFGSALVRVSDGEGTETTTGGNGPSGHDETSENLATTFSTVAGHTPPLSNPPFPASPIFTAATIAPASPVEGQETTVTVTVVDQDEVEGAVFKYSVDGGAEQTVSGAPSGTIEWSGTIPAQAKDAVVAWYCIASNTEGVDAVYPAGSPNFAAAYTVGKAPFGGDDPAKLLLTEISTVGSDQEYIEIYNPNVEAVDLSDYYLTDANYSAGGQFYYRIAEGNPDATSVGGGVFADFHCRFPAGFTIAAGDTIVVSVAGSITFNSIFGFDPDLELWEDDPAPDGVPDMRWIFGTAGNNSIISPDSTPILTNGAETVIFYHFIEGEDKVTDIDVFAWKDPNESTTVNHYFNKTGVTVGNHSYLPETGTGDATAFGTMNTFGNSYQRTDITEGGQTPTGSNGVDGRDETSENFTATFAMLPYDPSAPSGPPVLVDPEKLLITQVCAVGSGAEFIEIYNPNDFTQDMSRYFLTDAVFGPGNLYYWQIALDSPSGATIGGGAFGDFHAKFPDGFFIATGDTVTIAVGGSSGFLAAYGSLPDLKLFADDPDNDNVPTMEYVFGDPTNNSIINRTGTGSGQPSLPGLTDAAESLVLYHWITGEDRVVDIDVFSWRDALSSDISYLFSKTGITIGSHTYQPDTAVLSQTQFPSETDPGYSYHRNDFDEGTQTPTGSNGVGGRDETSENFEGTFIMAVADPSGNPVPGDSPPKLLLTEISTTGTAQEYIEICNPGTEDVDLSDYYLTDAIYSTGNQVYWRIAEGNPTSASVGGGAFFDFHARFPDGFSLAAGDTIVITAAGSDNFYNSFQFYPHLELYEDGASPDTIPDMRWIFGDEINNSIVNRTGQGSGQPSVPGLTNGGETMVLYHWTSGEDKVTDIDVFAWKDPAYTSTSYFFNKTGVTVGSYSYLPELGTNSTFAFAAQNAFGISYQRIDPTEGDQTPYGSNGVDGRDETSENFNSTFAMLPYDPFDRPTVIEPTEGDWQSVGSGPITNRPSVAHTWGDFDHNGEKDLILVRSEPGIYSTLIHDAGMYFSGAVEPLDGDPTTPSTDCVRGDLDQDGDLDLFITKGAGIDWFYNNGGAEIGWYLWGWPMDALDLSTVLATTGAQMIDTDLDGWLELFVTNESGDNQLLDGRFDMTNLMPNSLLHGSGTVGSAWCDVDGDRDPDLAFVTPEGVIIAIQDEPRRFTTTLYAAPPEARDVAWADYDNDGDFDFALVCLGANNQIFENLGDGTYDQLPLAWAGVDSSTGCSWGDFDNDGFLDLHVTNSGGANVLWRNEVGGSFVAVEDTVINHTGDDLGSSWLDMDADGDLDLYISNNNQTNRLIRNNLTSTDNWLEISVIGRKSGNQSNHGALGAVIEIEAGGQIQRRYVGGQEAGPGHSPLVQHFGLGTASVVDRVTVHWPFRFPNGSFHSTEMTLVDANQSLKIEETTYGVSAVEPVPQFSNSLMAASPNPFNPATVIRYSLERPADVTLDIFDVRGRLIRQLVSGVSKAVGPHQIEWRGKTDRGARAPSGVYIYRITAGDFTASRRMVMIK